MSRIYDFGHIWGLLYRSISDQFPIRRSWNLANVETVMVMVNRL